MVFQVKLSMMTTISLAIIWYSLLFL